MIPKREILDTATQTGLHPHVVEKDYVLGWVLAGIQQSPLSETWVFKGGTCLKKCYFETYRFSEDLDFTLRDPTHIDQEFLHEMFKGISTWVYEQAGIEIPVDRFDFDMFKNPRGVESCQGRIYYRGPVTPSGNKALPRVKLDLTVDEILVESPVRRSVRHDYSDLPASGISTLCYSYVEVFAEKIRALKERTRPRDLYDVVNFFRRPESNPLAESVRKVLGKKCEFKRITFPRFDDLLDHKAECASGWRDQLAHQLQALPPFDSFWDELAEFFGWLTGSQLPSVPVLRSIPYTEEEVIATIQVGTSNLSILDRIRFAAVNRLVVELDYRKENGRRSLYRIEPYSLRRTRQGHTLLYGIKLEAGEIRAFRTDRIINSKVTENAFVPRFAIDFIP
jgi:predicted nucleotidyltransferase component of viral defense system